MSVLSVGLPAMDLQAHYQTFFTGIVVVGAVLLDMYRNKKAAEVKITTPADDYKAEMQEKIQTLRQTLVTYKAAGEAEELRRLRVQIKSAQRELGQTYRRMRADDKAEQERIRAQERESEREFHEMLREREIGERSGQS